MGTDIAADSFTATGDGTATPAVEKVDLHLSGFGTATVKLQRRIAGTWTDVAGESYTADMDKVYESAEPFPLRWSCSAYTSGTILAKIAYPTRSYA